jgi:hypothetical protein
MRVLLPWLLLRWALLFGPGLLHRMLLSGRSFLLRRLLMMLRRWRLALGHRLLLYWALLLGCRAFLLRRLLMMLRWYRLMLRNRLLLQRSLLLGCRAFLRI